jgi:hypothetical protein
MKTIASICLLTVLLALSAAGQTPTTPTTPAVTATPITVLAMAGAFYDGSSHHAAARIGAFLPTGATNWLGVVADVGFAKDSPTSPKYVLSGKFLQKAGTITLGATKIDAYLVASVGGVVTGSTVSDVVKGAGGLVTTVAANGGSTFGYQAATGGGLNIPVHKGFHLHPYAEYARGSVTGSQISIGLMSSGEFQIAR